MPRPHRRADEYVDYELYRQVLSVKRKVPLDLHDKLLVDNVHREYNKVELKMSVGVGEI